MLIDLYQETWKELECGIKVKGHPFKACSLATSDAQIGVRQRIVILREITENKSLLFYTDLRSGKIDQIKKHPESSALFYNPIKKLQIFLHGKIEIHCDDEIWEDHRVKIDGKAINDYNTKYPPGKTIKNPVDVIRTNDLHFAVLELIPDTIEYLKLKAELNRLRAIFKKTEDNWDKTYLVP